MEVLSVCNSRLAVPLTVFCWSSVIRASITFLAPRRYDKYVGSHYSLYSEPPELIMLVELCLILSAALNATFILYAKARSRIRETSFAPVAVPEKAVTFLKSQTYLWALLGFVFNLSGGIYLYRNDEHTIWTWMYLLLSATHFILISITAVVHALYIAITSYLTSSYYVTQFRKMANSVKYQLTMRSLMNYAVLMRNVGEANSMWKVLLFQTTLCFVPIVSCCIVFTIRPPDSHPLLKFIVQLASVKLFLSISFVLLAFGRVEVAHRVCYKMLCSKYLSQQNTPNIRLKWKVSLILQCMLRSTTFTLYDMVDVNPKTFQIVS